MYIYIYTNIIQYIYIYRYNIEADICKFVLSFLCPFCKTACLLWKRLLFNTAK